MTEAMQPVHGVTPSWSAPKEAPLLVQAPKTLGPETSSDDMTHSATQLQNAKPTTLAQKAKYVALLPVRGAAIAAGGLAYGLGTFLNAVIGACVGIPLFLGSIIGSLPAAGIGAAIGAIKEQKEKDKKELPLYSVEMNAKTGATMGFAVGMYATLTLSTIGTGGMYWASREALAGLATLGAGALKWGLKDNSHALAHTLQLGINVTNFGLTQLVRVIQPEHREAKDKQV